MGKLDDIGFAVEEAELVSGKKFKTDFPKPTHKYRLVYENFQTPVEENYFYILGALKELGYFEFEKIIDNLSAGEQSSIWQSQAQRLASQQQQVSTYLANLGVFLKNLIQIIRDVRIADEKILTIERANKGDKNAMASLKDLWISRVEGGTQNLSSVYGLAREVGFVTLPDLFFSINPITVSDLNKKLDELKSQYNPKILEVLGRKLYDFLVWKDENYKEMLKRREFTYKHGRQHLIVMRTYIEWLKPYLRNIYRLQSREKRMMGPEIVGAFENAVVDVEYLAKKKIGDKYHSVVLVNFEFFTNPRMDFNPQRQAYMPTHTGRIELTLRHYVWDEEEIRKYVNYRNNEAFELLSTINENLKSALEALKAEGASYYDDLGKLFAEDRGESAPAEKKEEKKDPMKGAAEPFISVGKGFWELFTALVPINIKRPDKEALKQEAAQNEDKKKAETEGMDNLNKIYSGYKRSHGMLG